MTWELIIPGVALGLLFLSMGIELLMHDRQKAKELEFAIRRKQRELKELQKRKDTKAMLEVQKELMGLMGQNFRLKMKFMLISFPLFIIIFFWLSSMLSMAPLTAGGINLLGVELANLRENQQNLSIEFVASDITVSGENPKKLLLDDKGDSGDRAQVWWNVTASEGAKRYSIRISKGNTSDEKSYEANFVGPGALTPGFAPGEKSEALGGSIEIKPLYPGVYIDFLGMKLNWLIYYIAAYFMLSLLIMPLKNKLFWGHHKGIKYLEKLDREGKG